MVVGLRSSMQHPGPATAQRAGTGNVAQLPVQCRSCHRLGVPDTEAMKSQHQLKGTSAPQAEQVSQEAHGTEKVTLLTTGGVVSTVKSYSSVAPASPEGATAATWNL